MNRLSVLLLAIAYLAFSSGTGMCMHSCGKFFKQMTLAVAASKNAAGKCCSRSASKRTGADPVPDDCCRDGACTVKAETGTSKSFLSVQPLQADVCGPKDRFIPLLPAPDVAVSRPGSHHPPGPSGNPLYLRHCVFLM